jgi:hypothetical protein
MLMVENLNLSKEKDRAITCMLAGVALAAVGALVAFGFGAMLIVIGTFIAVIGFDDVRKAG